MLAKGIPGTRAYVEAQKGWEAICDGRQQDAAEAFALELAAALTDASLLLADVLYRASDIAGSIRVYGAALNFAPADDTFLAGLASGH